MNNKLLWKIVAATTLLIAGVWGFWTINIPPDETIGAQYKRSIRPVAPLMLVKVSEAADDTPIFWYNDDYGPMPKKIEKVGADEWVVTFRRHNR